MAAMKRLATRAGRLSLKPNCMLLKLCVDLFVIDSIPEWSRERRTGETNVGCVVSGMWSKDWHVRGITGNNSDIKGQGKSIHPRQAAQHLNTTI